MAYKPSRWTSFRTNEQVKEGEGKVVGTCDGSTQKIVYKRGVAEAPRDTKSQAK